MLTTLHVACVGILSEHCKQPCWPHSNALLSGYYQAEPHARCLHVVLQGQPYVEAGATAYDAVDGSITNITITGSSAVNTFVVSVQCLPRLCAVLLVRILPGSQVGCAHTWSPATLVILTTDA